MTLVVVKEKQKVLVQFGARVRTLRRSKNLSQEAFAAQCGLDRTYISGIERGVRNISLQNIKVIAEAFGISLSDFMSGL